MDFPDWEILPDHEFTNNLRITQDSDPKNNFLDYSDFILCPHDPLHPPIPSEPTIVKTIYTNPDHHDDDDEVKSASSHVSFEKKDNQFVDTTVVNSVDNDALKFETEIGDSNKEEDKNSGFNPWKWSLNGVGAICTFGVTAATICVLILGTHQKNKHHVNQKSVFSFYTDDKRIKRVMEHAGRWNEAISASVTVRNGPISRAHITYGAYPDGLVSID